MQTKFNIYVVLFIFSLNQKEALVNMDMSMGFINILFFDLFHKTWTEFFFGNYK